MPKRHKPRSGSMQFWPRKRARRHYGRVRSWADSKNAALLGFAGYKVGMTQIIYTDNIPNSMTKGDDIVAPVTVIECPPIKVAAAVFYKDTTYGLKTVSTVFSTKLDKTLERKIKLPKKETKKIEDVKDYDDIKLLVYTQPIFTGIGKKKPEIFEVALGGSKDDKLKLAKNYIDHGDKGISISEVFKEGDQVDIHAVTKGKGYQGPVKRFGVKIRNHKSEKTKRGPGSLGAWRGQGHMMYRVAHAGQMGYHLRTEYNKWIMKISDKPEDVNQKSGFIKYGNVKSNYILIRGTVGGSRKRIVRMTKATRPNNKIPNQSQVITQIYTS